MASLHTWAGLVPGWLLFVIFLFGTVSFFNDEISRWMRPELQSGSVSAQALDRAAHLLRERAPDADSWNIALPSARSGSALTISWIPAGASWRERRELTLDGISGREIGIRKTAGGNFLYRMHFDLHYMPVMWARYLVSIAALSMLVAILSGVVTHKKIFTDFFLLRFGKGQRSWLDAHNVTAILALPFHLMITYTGLATLLFTLMPWAISANFADSAAYYESVYQPAPQPSTADAAPRNPPLSEMVARAEQVTGMTAGTISIDKPGVAGGTMAIWPLGDRLGASKDAVYIDMSNGELIDAHHHVGGAVATHWTMVDLHAGRFSFPVLRWLYFLSGVGGTVMVASGLVLWTVKRRAKLPDPTRPHIGFRLVERLNIGVIAGSCAGIAVYFLANRLLPVEMASRADWEINSLFIAWGGVFVWTPGRPAKRAWTEALAACAVLYALVPVVNALTTARGLIPSLIAQDWVFVGFDGVMLAMAVACAFTAWKVASHKAKAAPRRQVRAAVEATL